MKNLLTILSMLAIGTTSVSALIVNSTDTDTDEDNNFSRNLYWNSDGSNKNITADASWNDTAFKRTFFTFNIGNYHNYTKMSLIDSQGFSFSWGNDRYGPWWFESKVIDFSQDNKTKINNDNFDKYLKYTIYDETINSFLAKCHSIVRVGYTWYEENGNTYFQFLLYQHLNPINSVSGGTNFANLGTSLLLS